MAVELRRRPTRDFSPLAIVSVAMLIGLSLLPSALNLPQSNPTQTLEYAPIPQDDDSVTPPVGNLSSLGLGSSSGLTSGAEADSGTDAGAARREASRKRCVGTPPKQTEDPNSPPCVASFSGDNGGGTYQGVTGTEIRVVLYMDTFYTDVGSRGLLTRPTDKLFDLAKPAEADDPYFVEATRSWQRYFNDRYQTYDRPVHFFVYYGTGSTPEARRADAAETFNRVKPFAVVVHDAPSESGVPYAETLAARGVLTFGLLSQRPEPLFQKYPRLQWGYSPSLERQAAQFVDYVCTKVANRPVSFGANDSDSDVRLHNGQPRRLGILYSTDTSDVHTKQVFGRLIRGPIEQCAGKFITEGGVSNTANYCGGCGESYPTENMLRFKQAGVSTIIWAQGYEPSESRAAAQFDYRPEWIVAGDKSFEDIAAARHHDPSVWNQAVVVGNVPLARNRTNEICYQAAKEANPNLALQDSSIPCRIYDDFRQLYIGIQVAGPTLGPTTIDRGFRAIPKIASGDPAVPACFYEPGDYTCVKDSIAMYWDADQQNRSSASGGCYRVPQNGKRYLKDTWPHTDVIAERGSSDPCNAWTLGRYIDPAPGPDSPPPQ